MALNCLLISVEPGRRTSSTHVILFWLFMSSMWIFRDLNTEVTRYILSWSVLEDVCCELKKWTKVDKKKETLWKGAETFPAFSSHKLENTLPPFFILYFFFFFSVLKLTSNVRLWVSAWGWKGVEEEKGFLKLFSYLPNTPDGVHRCLCVVWWFSQAALIQDDLKETKNSRKPWGEHLIIYKLSDVCPCVK